MEKVAPDKPSLSPKARPWSEPPVGPRDAAVYIHFPYCALKCVYCDFNSHVCPHDDVAYADAVLSELEARGDALQPPSSGLASVFFGGGTPSRWAPAQVGRVLSAVRSRYGLRGNAEVTLEANPEGMAAGGFEGFRAAGINRFSIGCQSFDDNDLKTLGRLHDRESAIRAVRSAKATGAQVSLDLIYGLPAQTEASALASVDAAAALRPDHVSAYTLTIEPETVLARRVRLGTFRPMPSDQQATLIDAVTQRLAHHGYERHEVSNYARSGRVAVHNTLYWLGGAYLGLGAGAHSYLPAPDLSVAVRRENERSPEKYVDQAVSGAVRARFEERRDVRGVLEDRAMLVFRSIFGLDPSELASEAGLEGIRQDVLREHLATLEKKGLLERRGSRWRPTDRGFMFNDTVARAMMDVVGEVLS